MNNNRIALSIAILIVVACLCLTAVVAVAGGAYLLGSDWIEGFFAVSTSTPEPPTATPSIVKSTPTPSTGQATSAPEATAALPEDVADQMDEIQAQVERIRSLEAAAPVNRQLLTVDQLRDTVENDFLADYTEEEVADDIKVLWSLGLLEPDYDLYNLYLELYTEQIAGYYDIEKDEMFVVLEEGFAGPQRSTYAHEYTHVLQNQNHDVRKNLNYTEEYCKTDSEYCAAIQALIEGDATLTEQSWLYLYATDQDMEEIDKYYETADLSVFDTAPAFMQEDFLFPYSKGVDFVLALYEQDGFAAIDQAYINPPVSTEQILHPERYPDDKPELVEIPDLTDVLGREIRELDLGVMGEWYTYLILAFGVNENTRLGLHVAAEAANGWGGDAYAIYWDDAAEQPVVVLDTTWDTTGDAGEFYNAFKNYGSLRWGKPVVAAGSGDLTWETPADGTVIFTRDGERTVWVIAPTTDDAQTLMQTLTVRDSVGVR